MSETREKLTAFQRRATDTARKACTATDEYVHENAWTSLAIAVGIGLLLGFILTGSRRRSARDEDWD